MDTVNLCIDIGNTSTKAALYRGVKEMEYMKPFTAELFKELVSKYSPTILVSKTGSNPELEALLQYSDYLDHNTPLPIKIDYNTPNTLGRDRIAATVGAFALQKDVSWLILDLGTCLTIDLLTDNTFRGGLITPGVQMRFRAMDEFTAGLPLVTMNYDLAFPGKSTKESMQVGVCQGITYEINGYINQMNTLHEDLHVVDCSSVNIHFGKEVKNKIFARQKLVLEGLNHIILYNAKK